MSKATEHAAQVVDRMAVSRAYVEQRLSLGPGTHEHKWDPQGRCLYCPERIENGRLMPQGRTGELTWEAK